MQRRSQRRSCAIPELIEMEQKHPPPPSPHHTRRAMPGLLPKMPELTPYVRSPTPPPPSPPPTNVFILAKDEAEPEPEPEPEEILPDKEPEEAPPPKRRPGRPRRSEVKQEPVKPKASPVVQPQTPDGSVILNARGMPVRNRKRNRYYEDEEAEEEERSPSPAKMKQITKKIKLEPLQQIILDNSSKSLQVTPIITEAEGGDGSIVVPPPLVHAKKSVVELVLPSPRPKVEPVVTQSVLKLEPVLSKSIIPKVHHTIGRPKSENYKGIKELPKVDIYRRSDYSSFIRFFANVKTKVIMPDRWGINGVMFDPVRKMKTFTISEMEISPAGEARVKKCIQVFEDLTLLVTVQGVDLAGKMSGIRRLHSETDVPGILSKINALKVCTGVKCFGVSDLTYHPTAKKKGTCYFASDCQTVLSFNYVGALCPPCNKLRNSVRRRKINIKKEKERLAAKPILKKVPSVFGRALFGMFERLLKEDTKGNKKNNLKSKKHAHLLPGDIKAEPSYDSANGHRRSLTFKTPRKPQKQRKFKDNSVANSPMTIAHVIDPITGVRHGLADYLSLSGDNIVIQNGGEFNFDDGQEYELIGEADAVDPLHIMDSTSGQTIQIIEVDDQTMAHFTAQNLNMGGLFFGDSSNLQVTEIDPNDPNTLFKVISPGEMLARDQKQ